MITKNDLKILSELSKLHLSEEDLEKYGKEMVDIMNIMDTIGESDFEYNPIDTESSVPFSSLRCDSVKTFDNMGGITKEGPETAENMFVVPKVVD